MTANDSGFARCQFTYPNTGKVRANIAVLHSVPTSTRWNLKRPNNSFSDFFEIEWILLNLSDFLQAIAKLIKHLQIY
jgi:hypothetical protein